MRSKNRKGAFQLSLGFIIGLIFAVILLTLSIMWIRGVFDSFSIMTNDLTVKASDELSETFKTGKNNFDVYPGEYTMKPGAGVKLSVGISNDANDGEVHPYKIGIIPSAASRNPMKEYCKDDPDNFCEDIITEMKRWLTFPKDKKYFIQPNTFKTWDVVITVPDNVKKGRYMYDIFACVDDKAEGECYSGSANWGSGAVPLTITIES